MARVKRAVNSRKNHKKVLKLAKGYYGGKSRLFKTANETVIRALRNAYVGRRDVYKRQILKSRLILPT